MYFFLFKKGIQVNIKSLIFAKLITIEERKKKHIVQINK